MSTTYPLHVDADLDPQLSRWLWLVKWVLALPHYVVLAFLWLAFVVLSLVALVAIAVTGRYPRPIFDFNVGVLRWSWRVAYYAYGALGTDRYPPFTLDEVPDYPAHLTVEYPEHLSRGLVLVKWWLLAIPHYLIVALLVGGGVFAGARATDDGIQPLFYSQGVTGLLVLVAAVALLFSGRYPRPVFDLVLGLNRWVLRVAAYAGLMTDQYPPFRLDQGGHEPGTSRLDVPPGPPPPPASGGPAAPRTGAPSVTGTAPAAAIGPGPRGTRRWGGGRVTWLVVGAMSLALSLGLGIGGLALLVVDQQGRDADGYLMSDRLGVGTGSYAIVTDDVELETAAPFESVPGNVVGTVRLTADPTNGEPVFVGIGRADDVASYLDGVAFDRLVSVDSVDRVPSYQYSDGGRPPTDPSDAGVWAAQSSGVGPQSVALEPAEGSWAAVVMNADGRPGVAADVAVGATAPGLSTVVAVLLSLGITGLLVTGLIFTLTLREPRSVAS